MHSDESKDLIIKLLEKDQLKRISLDEALAHDWFKEFNVNKFEDGIQSSSFSLRRTSR